MALREGDIGVVLSFDVGEDVSDNTGLRLGIRNQSSKVVKTFTAFLSGTQLVQYLTTTAADTPEDGTWDMQVEVTQPSTTRTSTIEQFTIGEVLFP